MKLLIMTYFFMDQYDELMSGLIIDEENFGRSERLRLAKFGSSQQAAGVLFPPEHLCKFASVSPARAFVSPPPSQSPRDVVHNAAKIRSPRVSYSQRQKRTLSDSEWQTEKRATMKKKFESYGIICIFAE